MLKAPRSGRLGGFLGLAAIEGVQDRLVIQEAQRPHGLAHMGEIDALYRQDATARSGPLRPRSLVQLERWKKDNVRDQDRAHPVRAGAPVSTRPA